MSGTEETVMPDVATPGQLSREGWILSEGRGTRTLYVFETCPLCPLPGAHMHDWDIRGQAWSPTIRRYGA